MQVRAVVPALLRGPLEDAARTVTREPPKKDSRVFAKVGRVQGKK
jgi:hypothetical protein